MKTVRASIAKTRFPSEKRKAFPAFMRRGGRRATAWVFPWQQHGRRATAGALPNDSTVSAARRVPFLCGQAVAAPRRGLCRCDSTRTTAWRVPFPCGGTVAVPRRVRCHMAQRPARRGEGCVGLEAHSPQRGRWCAGTSSRFSFGGRWCAGPVAALPPRPNNQWLGNPLAPRKGESCHAMKQPILMRASRTTPWKQE